MQTRIIGQDLTVSAVGLGCMGMSHAYGRPSTKEEARELLAAALDLGYTFFDTAEIYGTADNPHHNEELIGEILSADPRGRQAVIATKCGITFDTSVKPPYPLITDARPQTLRKSLEGSLKRLKRETIDLYYLHRADAAVPLEEVAETMAAFKREGKIREWGLSEVNEEQIRRAHAVCHLAAVQNRYSMTARHYEAIFPCLEELKIALVAFSPLANGLLTGAYTKGSVFTEPGDYRAAMPQFAAGSYEQNAQLMAFLKSMAEAKGLSMAALSLAWMLSKKPWIIPIPGTSRIERLKENAAAGSVTLTAAEVKALDEALDALPHSDIYGGVKTKPQQQ